VLKKHAAKSAELPDSRLLNIFTTLKYSNNRDRKCYCISSKILNMQITRIWIYFEWIETTLQQCLLTAQSVTLKQYYFNLMFQFVQLI